MIVEAPEKDGQLEADFEQTDMFFPIDVRDPDFGVELTSYYQEWRHSVRMRGFRYHNMFSNVQTRVITEMFRRLPNDRS